jgi:phosphoglycerate dehydrogenase-like enzyme
VLLVGFGSIARRLVELLHRSGCPSPAPAARRARRADPVVSNDHTDALLADADHVINILPDNPSTKRFFDAARFAR